MTNSSLLHQRTNNKVGISIVINNRRYIHNYRLHAIISIQKKNRNMKGAGIVRKKVWVENKQRRTAIDGKMKPNGNQNAVA